MVNQMPIIESLLDIDFYKFTMGQLVYLRNPGVPVRYVFINRTREVRLADVIPEEELREELDAARNTMLSSTERTFLRGMDSYDQNMFTPYYTNSFLAYQLPEYKLETRAGEFSLEFSGEWSKTIYWETIVLSIINELYYRNLLKAMSQSERDAVRAKGVIRLAEKIKRLKQRPDIAFSDFGTRRRFSRQWHDYVVGTLAAELPGQFLGTSNTHLAMKHMVLPMGTSAHELYMAYSGLTDGSDEMIRASHNKVLQDWWDQYGWPLSIALTDTYGTDFFFTDMTPEQAYAWKGLRHDSGDPIEFGEHAIRFYQKHGIDARKKLLVFSDGLTLDKIFAIADHFQGRIQVTFGWGTNLTNDFGVPPLSIVVKLIRSNLKGTVKLSDNLAKATGASEDIERFKRIFGYSRTTNEDTIY